MAKFFNLSLTTTKGASPEAQAIKRANLVLAQAKAKNPSGLINDPSVYDQAMKILEPFSYDVSVLTKQSQLAADKNSLSDKLNDQWTAKNNLTSALTNAQYQIGKNNAASPAVVIQKTAALYDLYAQRLSKEIDDRKANGGSYDQLIPELQKAQTQSESLASLSRATLTGDNGAALTKQQFGFLAKTDPQTGKVISFTLQPIDSANDSVKGYLKTDSVYGGVPLYLNGVRDPQNDNNLVAKLGDMVYKGDVQSSTPDDVASANGLNQKVLKLQNGDRRNFGQKFMDILPGNHVADDNTKAGGVNQVNGSFELKGKINPDIFSKGSDLPLSTVGTDSTGTYYFKNNDGKVFQSNDPAVIGKYTGQTPKQVEENAYFLTAKDVQDMKNTQAPDDRANSNLTDPAKNSPISATSTPPTSLNLPNNTVAPKQELAGGPEMPQTTGRERVPQQTKGPALQQQKQDEITKGGPSLFAKAKDVLANIV